MNTLLGSNLYKNCVFTDFNDKLSYPITCCHVTKYRVMIGLMKIFTPKFPFRRNTLHVFHDFSTIYNVLHDFYPQCVLNGEIFSFLYVVCSTSFDSLVEKLSLVCGEIYPSVSRPLFNLFIKIHAILIT